MPKYLVKVFYKGQAEKSVVCEAKNPAQAKKKVKSLLNTSGRTLDTVRVG